MTTVRLTFRMAADSSRKGTLYFQIIHRNTVKTLSTRCRIFADEWDEPNSRIFIMSPVSARRTATLLGIRNRIRHEMQRLNGIINKYDCSGLPYNTADIIHCYRNSQPQEDRAAAHRQMGAPHAGHRRRLRPFFHTISPSRHRPRRRHRAQPVSQRHAPRQPQPQEDRRHGRHPHSAHHVCCAPFVGHGSQGERHLHRHHQSGNGPRLREHHADISRIHQDRENRRCQPRHPQWYLNKYLGLYVQNDLLLRRVHLTLLNI